MSTKHILDRAIKCMDVGKYDNLTIKKFNRMSLTEKWNIAKELNTTIAQIEEMLETEEQG